MSKAQAPEIVSLSAEALEGLLASLQKLLPEGMYRQVAGLLKTLQWLMGLIQKKNTTLSRLQRLIFGASTEKTENIFPETKASDPPAKAQPKGHGRNGAHRYVGAQRVAVAHPNLRAGEACPDCKNDKGKLGLRQPVPIVRVTAQPIFSATIFDLQQLRCNLCGRVYTAPAPPEAGTAKYAPNVGVMLGLLRFWERPASLSDRKNAEGFWSATAPVHAMGTDGGKSQRTATDTRRTHHGGRRRGVVSQR